MMKINDRAIPKTAEGKNLKKVLVKVHILFMKVEDLFLMLSEKRYFQ